MRAPLYVCRPLDNADEVRRWAAGTGLRTGLLPGDMHVTVAFSRAAVDWAALDPDPTPITIPVPDGRLKRLGEAAIVLRFAAPELARRHHALRAAGASWDFPEYLPHVTITYHPPPGWQLEGAPPFSGFLFFGAERWKPLDLDRRPGADPEAPLRRRFAT